MAPTNKTPLTFLDHVKIDLKRFFSAGAGENAVLTLEKFIDHKIKAAIESLNEKFVAPKIPFVPDAIEEHFVDGALDKAEDWLEDKTARALEGMAKASSTVTEAPSTPADNAPQPASLSLSGAARAAFDALPSHEKAALVLEHAAKLATGKAA